MSTKSNTVWIRFGTDDHETWAHLGERIYAAGFPKPDPMSIYNGGIMLPLPLEVGSPHEAFERYEELFTGYRVETSPPDHLTELRGREDTDSFEAFVYNPYLDPERSATLRLFAFAMDKIAEKHQRIRKLSFAERAEMIEGHWHVGDQGILEEFRIRTRKEQPSFGLVVENTEAIQKRLWNADRDTTVVRGKGLFVPFEGRPTIKDADKIRALVSGKPKPMKSASKADAREAKRGSSKPAGVAKKGASTAKTKSASKGGQSTYWIEVTATDPENVVTRIEAGGIETKSYSLYSLKVPISSDPSTEAARVERLVRGEEQAVALPSELKALVSGDIPEGTDQSYPLGARAAYTRILRLVERVNFETYRLAQLYVLQIARVQERLGFEMKGRDALQWLVDNWQYGDKGCSEKLAKKHSKQSTPSARKTTRKHEKISRDAYSSESITLDDGSEATLVTSSVTGLGAIYRGGVMVDCGKHLRRKR